MLAARRAAGFVPTHIVDVSELNSRAEGSPAVLYIAAAAVVITAAFGAAVLKVRRARRHSARRACAGVKITYG